MSEWIKSNGNEGIIHAAQVLRTGAFLQDTG